MINTLGMYQNHHLSPLEGIGVVDHEPSPLRHLSEMPERVVEVLDRRDVGFRREVKWVLESCRVNELACCFVLFLLFQH